MAANVSGNGFQDDPTQGWVSGQNQRGTMDIIWSCLLTIFLCCWTSVCPNIPSLSDSRRDQFRDKFNLACIGILGPEFLLGIAAGQRASAHRSVQQFHAKGYKDWTITHAFYADMGGYLLQTPNLPAFSVNAKQLFYLIEKGYVEYPSLTKSDINDKNKADTLSRLITVYQVFWFTITCIARPIQHLAMSTLELTTISFILVMFATSYCWFYKPSDVTRPIVLNTQTAIAQILSEARTATRPKRYSHSLSPYQGGPEAQLPYERTPLDFLSRDDEWLMRLLWSYYIRILQKLYIPLFSRPVKNRPHDRIPSDNWLPTGFAIEVFSGVFIIASSATFACAWNFHFPSEVERILWRAASVLNLAFAVVGGGYTWYWHHALQQRRKKSNLPTNNETETTKTQVQQNGRSGSRVDTVAARLRNVSPDHYPHQEIPLRILVPVTFLCALYCLFRLYILVEDFIGLRSVPASVYQSIQWSDFIPHF